MSDVVLSPDQEAAETAIHGFLTARYPSRSYFVLQGLGGTGKSLLLAKVAKAFPNAVLCAYTGKAASVLRRRLGSDVCTLHQAIYQFHGLLPDDDDPRKMNPIFSPLGHSAGLFGRIILVDESSMLGTRVAEDLLATGARCVLCGDPGQLPPVKDRQFFEDADFTLTRVHRQAWDSPIIRQAHSIRSSGTYADDGAFRVVDRAAPEDLLAADVLLCWRNRTRLMLNARKRALLKLDGPLLPGEPVMCLKNHYGLGLYNGAVYDLLTQYDPRGPCGTSLVVDRDGEAVAVDLATVEGHDPAFERRRYEDEFVPFAVAYASTVHKSQGSEYENVLLIDEVDGESEEFRRQLLYTGVTRAKERCTVVRWSH